MRNCAPVAGPSKKVAMASEGGSSVFGMPSCSRLSVKPFFSYVQPARIVLKRLFPKIELKLPPARRSSSYSWSLAACVTRPATRS